MVFFLHEDSQYHDDSEIVTGQVGGASGQI